MLLSTTTAGGTIPWTEDKFLPSNGQITFIIAKAPVDPNSLEFQVNGVTYIVVTDYTLSGTTITWLNTSFTMKAGDVVLARYT